MELSKNLKREINLLTLKGYSKDYIIQQIMNDSQLLDSDKNRKIDETFTEITQQLESLYGIPMTELKHERNVDKNRNVSTKILPMPLVALLLDLNVRQYLKMKKEAYYGSQIQSHLYINSCFDYETLKVISGQDYLKPLTTLTKNFLDNFYSNFKENTVEADLFETLKENYNIQLMKDYSNIVFKLKSNNFEPNNPILFELSLSPKKHCTLPKANFYIKFRLLYNKNKDSLTFKWVLDRYSSKSFKANEQLTLRKVINYLS